MVVSMSSHTIAPAAVVRGEGVWKSSLDRIGDLCDRPLLLGRSVSTSTPRAAMLDDLLSEGLHPLADELRHDCCDEDIHRLQLEHSNCDAVIAQ